MLFPQQVVEQVVRAFTPTLLVPLFNGVVVVVELLLILEPEVLVEQAVVGLVVALPLRQQQVHLVLHLLVAAGRCKKWSFWIGRLWSRSPPSTRYCGGGILRWCCYSFLYCIGLQHLRSASHNNNG
jgi:hypothetical protein